MRISDWSSDVCSSDLPALPDEHEIEHPRFDAHALQPCSLACVALAAVRDMAPEHVGRQATVEKRRHGLLQIVLWMLSGHYAALSGLDRKSTRLNSSH